MPPHLGIWPPAHRHRTNPLHPPAHPLLLCQHIALLGNRTRAHCNRRNHWRPSRAAGSPHAKQCNSSGITLLFFHTDALHFFLQNSEFGRRKALLLITPHPLTALSCLTQCRNPPTFHHMEQSCSPAQEILLLFSP